MRTIALLLIFAFAALAQNPQTAVFPGAVADDEDLLVQSNSAQTTLNGGIDNSTLTIVLTSAANFTFPGVITIEQERIKVCSKSTNTLTVCTGGRGFEGTSAASHLTGVNVYGYMTGMQNNQLAAEVKAIEAKLPTGTTPPFWKNESSGTMAARNSGDTDYAPLKAASIETTGTTPDDLTALTAPAGSPASGHVYLWADDTDLTMHSKDSSGNVKTMVKADTGASNNFLTAISAAGVISKAQPSFSNISGTATSGQLPAASTTASGIAELAIASEVTTGTDDTRAVTPDALAGSSIFGVKTVEMVVFDFGTDVATGDGKFYFYVPSTLNGMNLISAKAQVITAGTTNTTDIQIARCAATTSGNACSGTVNDMLTTKITIDSGENSSDSAATAAVIDTSNDDVATGQVIRVDVDAVSTTAPKGLIVTLNFQLP